MNTKRTHDIGVHAASTSTEKEPEGKTELLNAVLEALPEPEPKAKPKRRRVTSAGMQKAKYADK